MAKDRKESRPPIQQVVSKLKGPYTIDESEFFSALEEKKDGPGREEKKAPRR